MLKELAKEDKKWRAMALKICLDKRLADDLTNEMYIKVYDAGYTTYNSRLIYKILTNLFINECRKNKDARISEAHYLECKARVFEPDDYEQKILDKYYELCWVHQELIAESYDKSLRDIQEDYPLINYGYAHREIHKGLKEVLGDDFHKYDNKRSKR